MTERRLQVVALSLFVVLAFGIFLFLFRSAGGNVPGGADSYRVSVVVPTAVQLAENADVRAAGVRVGNVTSIRFRPGGGAELDLELDDVIAPLSRDAVVEVRTKTLLGENYVSIEPGTRRRGTVPDGGTIPPDQVEDPVQIDQLLSVFDRRTRRAVSRGLRSMGAGLGGRGAELNGALGALQPATDATGSVASVLAQQRHDLHGVVHHVGGLLDTLGQRRRDITELVRRGRQAADLLAARQEQIRGAVVELPRLLAQTRATASRLGAFSRSATPILGDLVSATVALRPTVGELGPTARSGRRLFDRVPALVRVADPLLGRLRQISDAAPTAVKQAVVLLRILNPALRFLAPYAQDVGSFMANFGAINNEYDALGSFARVYPQFGPSSTGLVTPELRPLYDRLLDATGAGRVNKVQTDHYPKPGTIGTPGTSDAVPPLRPGR